MAKGRYKYIKSEPVLVKAVATKASSLDSEQRGLMQDKILKYKRMWDALRDVRENAERNINYTFGNQWCDKVKVGDEWMTEEQNILNQGKVPLKNNMIRQIVKCVTGVMRSNQQSPEAISRDRDEQKLGEMMTTAMQYVHDTNELNELDARMFEMFLMTSIACQVVRYKWIKEKQIYDVYVTNVNYARLFFNGDLEDPRGNDINTIGIIEDLTLDDVISQFARDAEDKRRIEEMYSQRRTMLYSMQNRALDDRRLTNLDFLVPYDNDKCRVIQAWELESKTRLRVHDHYNADYYITDLENLGDIIAENDRRHDEALANGLSEEEFEEKVAITYSWFYHQYWVCRYLTPYGDILLEHECPYWHNEPPFVLKIYPLVNSKAHSFVEDIIDQQRYINRMITLIDFIMGSSAKGVLVFPEDALGDMTKEEVLEEWVKYNGVLFAKVKAGAPMPQQISTNATNVGANELLQLQISLLREISGVSGALQGQAPHAGTPSGLYAQQTQNSQTNLLDTIESFNHFRRKRDYKLMKVIQQYYDTPRYINIAGKHYTEESKWYDPQKVQNSDFDIVITETQLTPAYRAMMNQFLMQIFQMGQMNVKTLLKASSYPFSDKILEEIEKEEQAIQAAQAQAAQEAQAAQQAAAGVSPMGGTPANDIGMPTPEIAQLSGVADPNAMNMLNQ